MEQFKKANSQYQLVQYYYQPAPLYQADLSIGGAGRNGLLHFVATLTKKVCVQARATGKGTSV